MTEEPSDIGEVDKPDSEESVKQWNYKQLMFYSLNNYMRLTTTMTTNENYPAKVNNMLVAVNALFSLFEPSVRNNPQENFVEQADTVYSNYMKVENDLNRRAQFANNEMQSSAYTNALLANRSDYTRATFRLIIRALDSEGQLNRREVGIIAGSSIAPIKKQANSKKTTK